MPRHHVSNNLKAHIPYLIYVKGFTVKETGCPLGVKKSMIYQTLKYFIDYGATHNPNAYSCNRGRHRKLDSIDIQVIKALLDQEPSCTCMNSKIAFLHVKASTSQCLHYFDHFAASIFLTKMSQFRHWNEMIWIVQST